MRGPLRALLMSLAASCAAPGPPTGAPSEPPPASKLSAPVDLGLTAGGALREPLLTLRLRVEHDVPRLTSRFEIPTGVQLVEGTLELEHGAVTRGADLVHEVRVRVSPGTSHRFFAGVDVHLAPGGWIHESAILHLGPPVVRAPSTRVLRLDGGAGVRVPVTRARAAR